MSARDRDQRMIEAARVKSTYRAARTQLREVGKVLRESDINGFMWTSSHKQAISGMCAMLEILENNVPDYRD